MIKQGNDKLEIKVTEKKGNPLLMTTLKRKQGPLLKCPKALGRAKGSHYRKLLKDYMKNDNHS